MASTLRPRPPLRLDVPSRPPANPQEAIEAADLLQSLYTDAEDPMHRHFAAAWEPWRPDVPAGKLVPDTGKLVRDHVPAMIRGKGEVPLTLPCADLDERYARLIDKLREEGGEYADHYVEHGSGDLAELADVMEVVEALAFLDGYTFADVRQAQVEKRADRGGFATWTVWFGNVPATTRTV